MKKIFYLFIGATILVLTGLTGFPVQGTAQSSAAEVVEMVAPPAIDVPENAEVIMVPKTKVYYVKSEPHLVYYNGTWYRQYETRWYKSTTYSGPWVYTKTAPKEILTVREEVPEGTVIHLQEVK